MNTTTVSGGRATGQGRFVDAAIATVTAIPQIAQRHDVLYRGNRNGQGRAGGPPLAVADGIGDHGDAAVVIGCWNEGIGAIGVERYSPFARNVGGFACLEAAGEVSHAETGDDKAISIYVAVIGQQPFALVDAERLVFLGTALVIGDDRRIVDIGHRNRERRAGVSSGPLEGVADDRQCSEKVLHRIKAVGAILRQRQFAEHIAVAVLDGVDLPQHQSAVGHAVTVGVDGRRGNLGGACQRIVGQQTAALGNLQRHFLTGFPGVLHRRRRIDGVAVVQIETGRCGVAAVRRDIVVAVGQREVAAYQVFIVAIVAIVGIRSLEDVEQAIAIGVGTVTDRRRPIVSLGDIQLAVVVGVAVEVVLGAVSVAIDRLQPDTDGRRCIARSSIIGVIQPVAVGIDTRRRGIVPGGLGFDIIGNAVVVTVDIQMIGDIIVIAVLGYAADPQPDAGPLVSCGHLAAGSGHAEAHLLDVDDPDRPG